MDARSRSVNPTARISWLCYNNSSVQYNSYILRLPSIQLRFFLLKSGDTAPLMMIGSLNFPLIGTAKIESSRTDSVPQFVFEGFYIRSRGNDIYIYHYNVY